MELATLLPWPSFLRRDQTWGSVKARHTLREPFEGRIFSVVTSFKADSSRSSGSPIAPPSEALHKDRKRKGLKDLRPVLIDQGHKCDVQPNGIIRLL